MEYDSLSREEKISEIRRIHKNLKRRIARVERRNFFVSQPTIENFKRVSQQVPKGEKAWSEISDRNINKLFRDLKYIDTLKTSRVLSAKKAQEHIGGLFDYLNTLSPEKRKDFWTVYGKIYETSPLYERFKYEIIDVAKEQYGMGVNSEEIVNKIIDMYEKMRKVYIDDDVISVKFKQGLNNLDEEYENINIILNKIKEDSDE